MTSLNTRDRDEFLRALEEARRAALRDEEEAESARPASGPPMSSEFLRVIDHMAGKVRSYVSTHLLSRLYAESTVRPSPANDPQPPSPPPPPKSDHDAVMEELHLTAGLSAGDLVRLRREFAKSNHPDRVPSPAREAATRRMTIANCIIDEALRSKKPRPQ
jgi:hypothetical protein